MEPENENVEPTRSLFGGPVPATAPVSEDSSVGIDDGNTESAAVEESVAVEAESVNAVAVSEEAVSNEQEPESSESEEAVAAVEADTPEPTVEEVLAASDTKDDQSFGSVGNEAVAATISSTEDTTLSVVATETEVAPATELPEIAKLKAEREKLDAAIQNKQLEERKSVISQIAAVVRLYDIPLLELFTSLGGIPNPRKGEKAPITHRDDQGNTWTGRGRTPRWLKDKNPDDYRV